MNGRRCTLAIFSEKFIVLFVIPENLRIFWNYFFTGGAQTDRCFKNKMPLFRYDFSSENANPGRPQSAGICAIKKKNSAEYGQSIAEAISNKNQPRLMPMRRATVSSSQPSGTLRVLPAMSARRFSVTWRFTMATVTP